MRRLLHWLAWWQDMRRCPHPEWRVACVHGDMINAVNGRRSHCHDCHRFMWELPAICWRTGEPHR